MRKLAAVWLAASLGACGGTTVEENRSPITGTGGSAAAGDDLAGVWDVVGTRFGADRTELIITVTEDEFTIAFADGDSITAVRQGDTFNVSSANLAFTATRTPSAGDLGAVPLALLGSWELRDVDGFGCSASVAASAIRGTCDNSARLGSTWFPCLAGTAEANKTGDLPSIFGDVGGGWHITTTPDGSSCDVRLEGSTFTATCRGNRVNGTLEAVVDGASVRGTTTDGVEFSAQRR